MASLSLLSLSLSLSPSARANNTASRYITSERVFCSACASPVQRSAHVSSFYLKSRDDFSIPPVLRLIARARGILTSLSMKT